MPYICTMLYVIYILINVGGKEKNILTLIKMVRKTSFKTVGIGFNTIKMERGVRLNSELSKDKWGSMAKEQREGASGWKITRRDSKGRGFLLH